MRKETTNVVGGDKGVTTVIGMILMVAIAVVLAGIVGFYATQVLDKKGTAPKTKFEVKESSSPIQVTLKHQAGDNLQADEITVQVVRNGRTFKADNQYTTLITAGEGSKLVIKKFDGGSKSLKNGDQIRVLWKDLETDKSEILFKHEVS